jgi:hypothetical protein
MKYTLCALILSIGSIVYGGPVEYKFRGNLDYTQQETKQMIHTLGNDFKISVYEAPTKSYMIFFGGSIEHNYDIFHRSYHINGFTNIGVEF